MWNVLAIGVPSVIFVWSFGSLVFSKLAKWSFEFECRDWEQVDDKHRRYIMMSKRYRAKYMIPSKYAQVDYVKYNSEKREIEGLKVFVLPTFAQLKELKRDWDTKQLEYQARALEAQKAFDANYNEMVRKAQVIPYDYSYGRPRVPQVQPFRFENTERKHIFVPIKHAKKLPDNWDPVTQTVIRPIEEAQRGGDKKKKGMPRIYNIIVYGALAIAIATVLIDFAIHVNSVVPALWSTFVHH